MRVGHIELYRLIVYFDMMMLETEAWQAARRTSDDTIIGCHELFTHAVCLLMAHGAHRKIIKFHQ